MRKQARRSLLQFKSQLRAVPVPRGAQRTREILEFVAERHGKPQPPQPQPRDAAYLARMFPPLGTALRLTPSPGVWYNVTRSRFGHLPVYTDYNNAGHCWTEVRRIEGSVPAFREDLQAALQLTKKEVFVKAASATVVVKGNRAKEIRELLQQF